MQELRAEHQKEMQEWDEQYGSDPSSAEAQAALQKLRQEHWSDMQKLFKKLGIKAPATAGPGSGMMRGAGGCGGACGVRRDRLGAGHRVRRRDDGFRQLELTGTRWPTGRAAV